jgi:hypothetical protein
MSAQASHVLIASTGWSARERRLQPTQTFALVAPLGADHDNICHEEVSPTARSVRL